MKKDNLLTVITPTYNRGHLLHNIYKSILQNSDKIKWLIIDDGSTDDTKQIIKDFSSENKININYYKIPNSGKHFALNFALSKVDTDLLIIVDSDDCLLPDAYKKIEDIHRKYENVDSIGFYSFARCTSTGEILVKNKKDGFVANYIDYRIRKNHRGDMAEVFKTKIINRYKFMTFGCEKFLSEDTLWIEISKKCNSYFSNEPIYFCEYLDDGLTSNDKIVKFKSPKGSMYRGLQLMYPKCGFINNLRGAIIYNCYKIEVKEYLPSELALDCLYYRILVFLTYPLGKYFNDKWKAMV